MTNVYEDIRKKAQENPDKIAFFQSSDFCTYEELLKKVDAWKALLEKAKLLPKKRVALFCSEGIEYVSLSLSILSIGAVVIPIPCHSTNDEIEILLSEMKVEFFIFEEKLFTNKKNRSEIFFRSEKNRLCISFYETYFEYQKEFEQLNPAFIRFTSGTTGTSKGVVLSHEAIIERTDAANECLEIQSEDTILWVLSMTYHFVVSILLFLRKGATIVLAEHKIPEGLTRELKEHPITFIYAAPLHYEAMISSSAITMNDCKHLRFALSTTTSLNEEIATQFSAKFNVELKSAYGLIEVGLPFVNQSNERGDRKSVGQILPAYQFALLDKDVNGVGCVQLKGPGMFSAYFNPWQIADNVLTEGWFCTGDLGQIDENGCLKLMGRLGQIINFMGMKIYAEEVRAVLELHPAIKEAYVKGKKHCSLGEIPSARLVLRNEDTDFDLENLRRFCYAKLASHKVPKEFEIVESLKKTHTQKIILEQ